MYIVVAILSRCIESQNSAQGREVCEYPYPAGKFTIWKRWAPEVWPVRAGGVPGWGDVGSGVGCLRRLGGGAPAPFWHHLVCRFFTLPFWQGRHPAVWLWRSTAGCLSLTGFNFSCPGNSTLRFFSSPTSARGFLIRYCVSYIAVRENPLLPILAILQARRKSDCSSCTRPPCLAIFANLLKT